ncbi:MAG: hypothetical protein JSU77_03230 [Fidelibacterota bacterium]|nr:MAG: hypothetical protein JSU77_03230 [Candidatus Neomarinimicrobiota bacterium]
MNRISNTLLVFASALVIVGISGCQKASPGGPETQELSAIQTSLETAGDVMFTGQEDHRVAPQLAEQMTSAFQNNNPYDVYAWFCSKKSLEMLLAQEGTVGIRIYGGLNKDGQFSPVLYGVNAKGDDLSGGGLSKSLSDPNFIGPLEMLPPCPPYCP